MNKTLLAALVATALVSLTGPTPAAESEAMQRERALNRILVAERQDREREAAARGSGLIALNTRSMVAKDAADKPSRKSATNDPLQAAASSRPAKPAKRAKP